MILFRLISWPYARKHVLRTILTAVGIALGVSVFVGMNAANQSILAAFAATVDRIAGRAELQVTAGDGGFPEDVLEQVQDVQCVRVAVPVIEAIVETGISGEGSLLVLAIDMTGDRSLRDYDLEDDEDAVIDDPLVFLAQPDSLLVADRFAERNGLGIGSEIVLGTLEGDRRFIVRGIMTSGGLRSAFGGNLAIMDIYAAQKMFGRGRTFDRIDLAVHAEDTVAGCQRELQDALSAGFQVETPAGRGQQFEAMIGSYSLMMNVSSLFALFIGMFIIYNAFAIAVTERRSEIGILRALGASRGQVRWLFVGESATTGIVGSIAGVFAGLLIARGVAATVGGFISGAYGVAQGEPEVAMGSGLLATAVGLGVATSIVAALVPARAAARIDPVLAVQKGRSQLLTAGQSRVRLVLAAACGLVSGVFLLSGGGFRWMFYASFLLVLLVMLLLTPAVSLGLARLARPMLKWIRPVEGALAADSLVHAPRRMSASVAALMLSLALVVGFGGMARASYGSIMDWVDGSLNADLFVTPSPEIVAREIRFPSEMAEEVAAIPGVDRVQVVRQQQVTFGGVPVLLVALDLSSVAETTRVRVVAGTSAEMVERASAGEGVIVSDNLARLQQLALGDVVDIPSPGGVLRLPIVRIIVDHAHQNGVILIDHDLFLRYWRDDAVNFLRVYRSPGANAAEVRRRILERYAGERRVFVLDNSELTAYIGGVAGQWYALTYLQAGIAVLVAILGIVNTLTVSVTDRRRELGVLRAVGGLKTQIRRTIWIEAVTIGALGVVLGWAVGAVILYYVLEMVRQDVVGMQLDYQFPVPLALAVLPVMLVVAFVAALWPAELAVRGSLVEALEYE
jgi:putative ABC transport system permease protein